LVDKLSELIRNANLILHEDGLASLVMSVLFRRGVFLIYWNNLDGSRYSPIVGNPILMVINSPEEFNQLLSEGFNLLEYMKATRLSFCSGQTLFLAFIEKEVKCGIRVLYDRSGVYSYFCPSLVDDGHTAYIDCVWTNPDSRRFGFASFVYSAIFDYLSNKGMSRVINITNKGNVAANNCQAKLGSYLWGEGYQIVLFLLLNIKWVKKIEGVK
jgi:GNAT superfamily N-acetyltransferase